MQLPHWMLTSAAWCSLTPQAVALYVLLASRYNGVNNGAIALSVRDAAARCRIAKNTAARALKELEAKGFTRCVTPGGFAYKKRHATEWALTQWPIRDGEPAPRTFMTWRAPDENAQKKPRSQNEDMGVPDVGP